MKQTVELTTKKYKQEIEKEIRAAYIFTWLSTVRSDIRET